MYDLFSADGINSWRNRLAQSDDFATAAGGWAGTMLLVESGDAETERATWLSVANGVIIEARLGDDNDRSRAEFILAADASTWKALVSGRLELISAAMTGKLKLVAGSVFKLIPHAKAASRLLQAAGD